jgi:ABC-2 type transport system permease protein
MIALCIAKKNIVEFFRNIKENAIVIFMPIMFIAVFGFIFKSSDSITIPIAVKPDADVQYTSLIEILKNAKNSDNKPIFEIKEFTEDEKAKDSVIQKNNVVFLQKNPEKNGILLTGDNRNTYFSAAQGIISSVGAGVYQVDLSYIKVNEVGETDNSAKSAFDRLVPGLISYGLLILIPYNAALFAQITEKRQIVRYYLSNTTAKDILIGYVISQTIFALLQTILLVVTAQAFGFQTSANIFEVMLIAIPANIFIVGISLLIGSFVKTSQTASNLGTILSVILGFLSGSFIVGIETIMKVGEWQGRTISANQIFPTTLSTQAWSQILLYGKHLDSLSFELIGMTVISIILLIIGIFFYSKFQLRRVEE